MKSSYDFAQIEKKWQKIWDDEKAFAASDDYSKPKYYAVQVRILVVQQFSIRNETKAR